MPRIPRFRDALGRWLPSNADQDDIASVEIYDTRGPRLESYTPEEYFDQTKPEETFEPFWTEVPQERIIAWTDFDNDMDFDPSRIPFPDGVSQFRVFFTNNPEGGSPSGVIGTTWLDPSTWSSVNLDMMGKGNPTGIHSIIFER